MSAGEVPTPLYTVTYTQRVLDGLVRLGRQARERGDGEQFVTALKEFHRRLCLYPQFGDPLNDLRRAVGYVRIGILPPLSMRYAVLEERRSVFVGAVPVLLPRFEAA